jgi:hypothetical protein
MSTMELSEILGTGTAKSPANEGGPESHRPKHESAFPPQTDPSMLNLTRSYISHGKHMTFSLAAVICASFGALFQV